MTLLTLTINYYEARNLAENHPHRHHDSDGYRHYIWCYILHVASAETATPKTQPATLQVLQFYLASHIKRPYIIQQSNGWITVFVFILYPL